MQSTEGRVKDFVGVNREEDDLQNSSPFTFATLVMNDDSICQIINKVIPHVTKQTTR